MIAFENEEISVHRMNSSFICNLWNWINVHSVDRQFFALFFVLTRL